MPKPRAVTLIELILAIVLLGVITLALTSIQMFGRYHVLTADRRARIQNEASAALAHMQRNISRAIGGVNYPPFIYYADNRGIRVRIDDNPANGRLDATDRWIGYRHVGSQILYYPDDPNGSAPGTPDIIASHVVITNNPGAPPSPTNPWGMRIEVIPPEINRFDATIRTRWNPDPAVAVSPDNPEVVIRNTIIAPSISTN